MYPQSNQESLELWISDQIRRDGPVTFARFMAWALYHPRHGYYTSGPNIGPRGDFVTSPEASPAFGALLARHVQEIDLLLGQPEQFDLLECGPGRGALAADLVDTLHADNPDLYRRMRYWLVDVSPALIATQKDRLLPRHQAVTEWNSRLDEIPKGRQGVVIANELIDAFPVHVLENRGEEILEHYVALDDDGTLTFVYGPLSDPMLQRFLEEESIDLHPGERIEVNLAVEGWLQQLSATLNRGVVTIIDYGDQAPERYSPARREGTLLGYFGGSVTANVLAHPGKQDLTALVDFTALQRAANHSGFEVAGMTRQAHFLLGLGLGSTLTPETATANIDDAIQYRRGLQSLVSMEGLGRFHVLLLGKSVEMARSATLSGLKYMGI